MIKQSATFSRHLLSIIFLQLCVYNYGHTQCPSGNISINTQDSLDNFIVLNSSCDTIDGDFILSGSNITDISGLDFLTTINGKLRIAASNLLSLSGLENITSIGTFLQIQNCSSLSNLQGITSVDIKVLPEGIFISNNASLRNIEALHGLTAVDEIKIENNPQLQSLSGLERIDSVYTTIKIDNNDSLVNLLGIDSLEYVGNDFIIEDHALLTDCSLACQYIDTDIVQGQTTLRGNPSPCSTTTEVTIYCQATACPENDFILTTQEEVDAFANVYGACDTITGSFTIDGNISDLSELSFIKVITEDLTIQDNNIIDSLLFLENLISVGGNITIRNMDNLKGLYGFPASVLQSINGDLIIRDHAILENIDDLEGITEIQGEVLIRANSSLVSITGLRQLNYVKNNLFLSTNGILPSLDGLQNVNKIDGGLIIANHPLLNDCNAICLLVSSDGVAGNISMNNNPFPCNGAANLEANCTPPPCIIGSVTISSQEDHDTFAMHNAGCDTLFGNLIIQGSVSDLSPLSFVRLLTGSFTIRNTSSLMDLAGQSNLTVQGPFIIQNNDITSLSGFDQLTLLDDIEIINNNTLMSLSAMNSLTSVNGDLKITDNNALTNLNGLESLVSISESLLITDQDNLNDIGALSNLTHIGLDLFLQRNSSLSDCSGICQIIHGTVVQRDIMISNNLTDCNSLKEVQLACTADQCDGRDIVITNPITTLDTTRATHSITSNSRITGNAEWKAGFTFELNMGFEIGELGLLQLEIIDRCDE